MSTRIRIPILALCAVLGGSAPALAQGPGAKETARLNTVSALKVQEREDGTYIRIRGSNVPTFSVFKLADPPRLFVDISNSTSPKPGLNSRVQNGVISQVAVMGTRDNAQELTRVIIGFDQMAHYDVRTEGHDVVVFIDGKLRSQDTLTRAGLSTKAAGRALASTRQQLRETEEELAGLRRQLDESKSDTDKAKLRDAIARAEQLKVERESALDRARKADERAQAAQARLQVQEKELERARADLATARKKEAVRASLPAARAVAVDPNAPAMVRDIRLETTGGKSRIVVELNRPGSFQSLPGRDSRAVMILNNARLPQQLEKTLSDGAQGGAVRFVSSFVDKGKVRLEAELRGSSAETIRQDGNKLIWEFAPAVAATQAAPVKQLKQADVPKRPDVGQSYTSAPPRIVTDPSKETRVPGMSRKRLTIDLREADLQNVLRLISKEGGINIITSDDVKGTVTMRLRSVPLEQVFLTILQSKSLGYELRGNILRVAPQKTLVEEEKVRAVAREASERARPLEVFLLPINYAAAKDLVPQIQGLLTSRGSVTVDARTNTIIVKDVADNVSSIRTLIETLDSQVPQVLIEARIVETNDTFTKQLGIQWGGDLSFSQANGNPTGLIFPNVLGIGGAATDGQTPTAGTSPTPNFGVNLPAAIGTGSGGGIGLTMGSVGGAFNLNLRLTALEQAGSARIVSAPKILTLDNREATISQGTSIPISVVSAAGVQTVFVDATLQLKVRPHVTPDGNIQLQIQATKNEPDFQNTGARGDPTIIRRQAQTELLIKDGDTTVIGGIYTRNSGSSLSAVPFFHKIPILGYLFRTTSESERRNELLIFITPRIVNRTEALGAMSTGTVVNEGPKGPNTNDTK